MKLISISIYAILLFCSFFFVNCKKESGTPQPPAYFTANAGKDQHIFLPDDQVVLGYLYQFDDGLNHYSWKQLSGPSTAVMENSAKSQCHVTHLQQGDYQFSLTVTPADVKATDTVNVFVGPFRSPINLRMQLLKELTSPGDEPGIAYAGNKVVFGGTNGIFDMYDIVSKTWIVDTLSVPRHTGIAVGGTGNKIFFAGGLGSASQNFDPSSRVDIYDVVTESWETGELSVARGYITILPVGSKVFFIGGTTNSNQLNAVDIYDLNSKAWTNSNMDRAGYFPASQAWMNTVYVLPDYSNIVEIYQPSSNAWQSLPYSYPKGQLSSASMNGKIYFAGGVLPDNELTNQVDILDVATSSWSVQYLTFPKSLFSTVVMDSKIVFLPGPLNSRIDVLDTQTNTWSVGSADGALSWAKWIYAGGHLFATNNVIAWECAIDF